MKPPKSKHAQARARQRGYRDSDIDFVMKHGTAVDDGSFLSDGDSHRAIEKLKQKIQKFSRLKGTVVIQRGDTVVTVYRPDKCRTKKLMGRY
jgi:hypothetical protein